VKAVEPLSARVHVNEGVAVAASRLQHVAESLDPALLDRGRRVDMEKDSSGGVSLQSFPEGVESMIDLRSAARA
jgi:hypothetical protein